jgi:hypothetical protein
MGAGRRTITNNNRIAKLARGFIAFYLSFNNHFIIMGIIQAIATIIQARVLFVRNV